MRITLTALALGAIAFGTSVRAAGPAETAPSAAVTTPAALCRSAHWDRRATRTSLGRHERRAWNACKALALEADVTAQNRALRKF